MTELIAPLPESVRRHLDVNTHPGLELDKYARSWSAHLRPDKLSEHVQGPTIDRVVARSQSAPAELNFTALTQRRDAMLDALHARFLVAVTTGPLTLHLSRASALENAGICLHPLYGFVYLPGTGLKGMARAYAEIVWKPTQPAESAKQAILRVFGNESGEPEKARQRAGGVVFHDAWPVEWPLLQADIVNNHHRDYYSDKPQPPGDWEAPNPVNFLSVRPKTAFSFAVSKRRREREG